MDAQVLERTYALTWALIQEIDQQAANQL